jgi:hypothetical protein
MLTTVRREAWRSTGELTGARTIDWAREVRKRRLRRGLMRAVLSLVGYSRHHRASNKKETATDAAMWTVPS